MTNRRDFLRTLAAGAAVAPLQAARKPNFIVILADDMGYSDAGCYGGDVDTPVLDRLAANGLRFTQAYSTARCGPSRGCVLTGYYAQQTASDSMTPGNTPAFTRFIPDYLNPLGYRSYYSGKWHIKFDPREGVGFHRSYAVLDENRFFTPNQHELDGKPQPVPKPEDGYYSTTAMATQAIGFLKDHAANHRGAPFFLYFTPHSPHFPLHAPQADIDRYKGRFTEGWDTARERKHARMKRMGLINCPLPPREPDMWTKWNSPDTELTEKIGKGEVMRAVPWESLTDEQKEFQRLKMAIHAAMISRMDAEIGRIMDQVKAMGAERDTLVMFVSDNGASSEQLIRGDGHDRNAPAGAWNSYLGLGPGWSTCSNTPFRLHKSWVHEGGISSPMIVHWPAGIKDRGKLRHDPCHFVDILPTLVDLAGGSTAAPENAPPVSGRSIAPAFKKSGAAPRVAQYFNHSNNRAIRDGDWKAVAIGLDGKWELYNLATDRSEMTNLAAKHPDRVNALAARWKEMDESFVKIREAAPPTNRKRMGRGRA